MLCLAMVLAIQASIFQASQAVGDAEAAATQGPPSCDIKDVGCILKDAKAALDVNKTSFESEYQQFAEMIAPVLLLAHGGNFEVCSQGFPDCCQRTFPCLGRRCFNYSSMHRGYDWLGQC